MKTTQLDKAKADQRKQAVEDLKARGPIRNEKSVAYLRERVALIEHFLGISE